MGELPNLPPLPTVEEEPLSDRFRAGDRELRPLRGSPIEIPGEQDEARNARFEAWKIKRGDTQASLPEFIVYEFLTLEKKQVEGVDFCPAPGQRVLTLDLRWVPVESLDVGESLLCFDEFPSQNHFRHWRVGHVVSNNLVVVDNLFRITLSDGTELATTGEHRWLSTSASMGGRRSWVRTDQMKEGRRILRFLKPWSTDTSREAGWLAGFYDGEGTLCSSGRSSGSRQLSVAQKPGEVLDLTERLLHDRGFQTAKYVGKKGCVQIYTHGGFPERARFLGSIRPLRLLKKFAELAVGSRLWQLHPPPQVTSVKRIGRGEVCALQSSHSTYILEGFGAHNTYQDPFQGGRTEKGGFVLDFLLIVPQIAWRIQGERFHLFFPQDRARDILAREVLEGRGIKVLDLFENDILGRPTYVLELAWNGQEVQGRIGS